MKKHIYLSVFALCLLSLSTASQATTPLSSLLKPQKAEKSIQCLAQLVRVDEKFIENLPGFGQQTISIENNKGKTSFNFSLKGKTDLIYRLDLSFKMYTSNWASSHPLKDELYTFKVSANLWDVKNNTLIGSKTTASNQLKNLFFYSKLFTDNESKIVTSIPNIFLRSKVLSSKNSIVSNLGENGDWGQATEMAYLTNEITGKEADFASISCTYKN